MAGIFKAYDIRGVYPSQLNEELAEKIGFGIGKTLNVKTLAVGGDMRVSTPTVKEALIKGILATGTDVVDIGLVTTPMTYFAVGKYGYDGGIMVTASHNPGQYNGFKICRKGAYPVSYETGINEVEKIALNGSFVPEEKVGTVTERNVLDEYLDHVISFAEDIDPLKIVADAGNGVEGITLEKLFAKLPCDLTGLYLDLDGTFPNHEANPLDLNNMKDLVAKVKETGADFGVAFDGDGDRAAFVDEKGVVISNDLITALIAQEILTRNPGSAFIYDLRSSQIVKEEVVRLGGRALESRVGHSFIKKLMRDEDAAFGGELSGHFYFRDNYFTDSGLLALISILNLVCKKKKPLSELVKPLRKYYATGEVNFKVDDPDEKIKLLESKFSDAEVYFLDGITVRYKDWWFNVRKSNTEAMLRLNLEANSQELMDQKKQQLEGILQ